MSRGSSGTFLSVVNQEIPNDIFLHLVTLYWPDGATTHYVKNFENITSRGVEYEASSFNIQLPDEPDDSIPEMRFMFAVVERDILRRLNSSLSPPQMRLEIVLASDPDVVELGPFDFEIREYQAEGIGVSVTAGFEPILDLAVPQLTYNTLLFPALFKDVRGQGGDLDLPTGTPLPKTSTTIRAIEHTFNGYDSGWITVESILVLSPFAVNLVGIAGFQYNIISSQLNTPTVHARIINGTDVLVETTPSGGSFSSSFTTISANIASLIRVQIRVESVGEQPQEPFFDPNPRTTFRANNRFITVNSRN